MSKRGNFLLGAGIGLGLGILFAPKSGKETREDLKKSLQEFLVFSVPIKEVLKDFNVSFIIGKQKDSTWIYPSAGPCVTMSGGKVFIS